STSRAPGFNADNFWIKSGRSDRLVSEMRHARQHVVLSPRLVKSLTSRRALRKFWNASLLSAPARADVR
ncbi:hypothetical protein GUG17_03550, partial [Xanthomonas citri pv. citri]|nr:hypothetical protein [Xanthomonas citri pv. citri]